MTTLHAFHRPLATLDDFDEDVCQPQLGTDMGIVPVTLNGVDSVSSSLFITALVDHLCSLYIPNATKKDKLFQIVYKLLVNARVLPADFNALQPKSVWFRCQALFIRFLEAAMKQTDSELDWSVNSERVQSALQRLFPSVPELPAFGRSREFLTYLPTRLSCEFSHLRVIGKGADGRVYRGLKKSDGVMYAIKEIKLDYSSHHDIASSTSREAEFLATLSHPHVVRYYDNWMELKEAGPSVAAGDAAMEESEAEVDDDDDDFVEFKDPSQPMALVARQPSVAEQHAVAPSAAAASHNLPATRNGWTGRPSRLQFMLYIQMELCSRTLKQWLEERNRTVTHLSGDDVRTSKKLFKQILQGVQYIHSKDLLHRDLKPQNVFLTLDSEGRPCPKIGDFGHSRLVKYRYQSWAAHQQAAGGDAGASLTENLTRDVGTTLYSAPEQLNCTEHSTKSDMYSLGLVLYELYHPFTTESERYDCLANLRRGRLDDEFKHRWPQEAECISELTHDNPAHRPSASELLHSSIFLSKDELIRQLRGQVSELQRALSHKDCELHEKDARIAELENQLHLLPSDFSRQLPVTPNS